MIMRHGRTTLHGIKRKKWSGSTSRIRVARSRLVKMCLNKVIRERIVTKNKAVKGGRGPKKEKLGGEAVGA